MKDNKRFIIVLFVIGCASILLLSVSFSKESGSNSFEHNSVLTDTLKVNYSRNNLLTLENSYIEFSVINQKNSEVSYYVDINNKEDLLNRELYYIFDNGDKIKLNEDKIYIGKLASFGSDGDFVSHSLRIFSKDGEEFRIPVLVDVYEEVQDNEVSYGS